MIASDTIILLEDLVALVVSLALLAAGLVMIFFGSRTRSEQLAHRVDVIRHQSGNTAKTETVGKHVGERMSTQATDSLTAIEHQQVIRIFSRFGVSSESALTWFNAMRVILPLAAALLTLPFVWGCAATSRSRVRSTSTDG